MAFFSKKEIAKKSREKQSESKKHTLLLVDDEAPNLRSLSRLLAHDYNLLTAQDGQEALELVQNLAPSSPIHLIISDQRMPKLTGVEFLKQTIPIIPKTIRMILTGFSDVDAVIDSINDGHIYNFIAKPFDPNDLKLTVKRALERYDLEKNKLDLLQAFETFVPKQFLSRVAPNGLQNLTFGEAKSENLSILFAGIWNFKAISLSMAPQEVLDFLSEYSKQVSAPIDQEYGFIDKFFSSSTMALFDRNEQSQKKHAQDSVNAAISMQKAINQYNFQRNQDNLPSIRTGIGIHTGEVIVGTVGSDDRMDSTVLGDSVNLASRLQSLCQSYEAKILISESCYELIDAQDYCIRPIETLRVKGKTKAVTIYEVFDADSSEKKAKKIKNRERLEQGIRFFGASEFEQARQCFESCLSVFPRDPIVHQYLHRIDYMKQHFNNSESSLLFQNYKNSLQELMKRKSDRYAFQGLLQIYQRGEMEPNEGKMVNFSKTGMRFESACELEHDTCVGLEIAIQKSPNEVEAPLRFLGTVVRKISLEMDQAGVQQFAYAIEFIKFAENGSSRINQWLNVLESTQTG